MFAVPPPNPQFTGRKEILATIHDHLAVNARPGYTASYALHGLGGVGKTQIAIQYIYDHNADRPDYPISILDDAQAAKYIDGSGFHFYGGTMDALTDVHNAHPNKNIYFTEQMVVQFNNSAEDAKKIDIEWPVSNLLIDVAVIFIII